MKIHKAILIQPSDEYMVRVWDSQEPKEGLKNGYRYNAWLQSYKEYEVHPNYVNKICLIVMKKLKCDLPLSKHLVDGVDLTPDLIEIKDGYAILKDKQVESEDDVWSALENDMFNSFINWDLLKQKYTLKRK